LCRIAQTRHTKNGQTFQTSISHLQTTPPVFVSTMYLYVCTQIMDWAHAYIIISDISPIRKKAQEMAADDVTVQRYELPLISGKKLGFSGILWYDSNTF
jgi:hypothetical protein